MPQTLPTELPSIGRLAAPKLRGNTTHPRAPHPLRESVCASCDVDGFVERCGDRLTARLERAPVDGIELLTHARGMNSPPEPWLTFIMSVDLFTALRGAGLTTGLATFEFERVGGRCKPYVGIFAETRLAPMATPFGRDPTLRNCDVCGFVNAARAKYPLYPRPWGDLHWYGAPPWGASAILASRDVWGFLVGPGRELYGPVGAKVRPTRAGWWPDEQHEAFEATVAPP